MRLGKRLDYDPYDFPWLKFSCRMLDHAQLYYLRRNFSWDLFRTLAGRIGNPLNQFIETHRSCEHEMREKL